MHGLAVVATKRQGRCDPERSGKQLTDDDFHVRKCQRYNASVEALGSETLLDILSELRRTLKAG